MVGAESVEAEEVGQQVEVRAATARRATGVEGVEGAPVGRLAVVCTLPRY